MPKTLAVDRQLDVPSAVREVERVAAGCVRKLQHLELARLDAPERLVVPDAARAVRRAQLLLDRAGEYVERVVRTLLDEKRAVGERDEAHRIGSDLGRIRGDDCVRRPRTEVARDAGLLPQWPWRRLRSRREPAFAREPCVERFGPPEEAHA